MSNVEQSIEVGVPVRVAYDQWTQFESFPQFMEGIEEVRQIDDTHLHWRAKVAGHVAEWDAVITEQLPDERIAWLTVTKKMRHHYRATIDDTETFVNQLTLIEGVDIGMLFREEDDGRIKVSVRGNGEIPAIGIAKKFGGGGHRHAAGAKIHGSLEETIQRFYDEATTLLKGYPSK